MQWCGKCVEKGLLLGYKYCWRSLLAHEYCLSSKERPVVTTVPEDPQEYQLAGEAVGVLLPLLHRESE